MKKLFILNVLLAFFLFSPEASSTNPYDGLKEKQDILENLSAHDLELKNISCSIEDYYGEIESVPSNVIKLDPFCGDGIQRILKDVQGIRKIDPIGSIIIFFDIDQFTLWKNGFTPMSHLSEIEVNNFYEPENHKSLFRDTEFLNVIKEFKKLNCVFYGLTARYSNLTKYSENDLCDIKTMCHNLQQLIKFDNFPKEFKYPNFFSHDLSENNVFFEPLFGCSGIFLTARKLKAIQYLFKDGQELGLFNSKTVPSHIIFGDDSAHNFRGEISKNMKCYHWPYPYDMQPELLPFIKLHREDKNEAFTHIQYVFCAQTSLGDYAYNLLGAADDDEEIYAKCVRAMLDEVFLDKKGSFLNYMGGYTPFHSLNAVIDYLKWNHEDHKDIQKFLLDNALVSCIFSVGLEIYQQSVSEFSNRTENELECQDNIIVLGDSPRKIIHQREKIDSHKVHEYRLLCERLQGLFTHYVWNEESVFCEKNVGMKEKMLNNIIEQFIFWYAYEDKTQNPIDLYKFVKMSSWQDEKLN